MPRSQAGDAPGRHLSDDRSQHRCARSRRSLCRSARQPWPPQATAQGSCKYSSSESNSTLLRRQARGHGASEPPPCADCVSPTEARRRRSPSSSAPARTSTVPVLDDFGLGGSFHTRRDDVPGRGSGGSSSQLQTSSVPETPTSFPRRCSSTTSARRPTARSTMRAARRQSALESVVRRIVAATIAAGALVLGACESERFRRRLAWVPAAATSDPCRNARRAAPALPSKGAAGATDSDGPGCAPRARTSVCDPPAFSWTWNPSGCRIPAADAGIAPRARDAARLRRPEQDAAGPSEVLPPVEDAGRAAVAGGARCRRRRSRGPAPDGNPGT